MTSSPVVAGVGEDPHMQGLLGQLVDWEGQDGAWYALLSDTADMKLSIRVTAPMPEEYPDRQLMTSIAIKYEGGYSIAIENKHPYTTQTHGCDDWFAPCLSDHALRITVDEVEQQAVPVENAGLPGHATMTAVNLPPECQAYGGDRIWADTYAQMMSGRKLAVVDNPSINEWIGTWSSTTAPPGRDWCGRRPELPWQARCVLDRDADINGSDQPRHEPPGRRGALRRSRVAGAGVLADRRAPGELRVESIDRDGYAWGDDSTGGGLGWGTDHVRGQGDAWGGRGLPDLWSSGDRLRLVPRVVENLSPSDYRKYHAGQLGFRVL